MSETMDGKILKFRPAGEKWWNKPLVSHNRRHMPAELAILSLETGPTEAGAWMNSRGTASGVVELVFQSATARTTRRVSLPPFVSEVLKRLLSSAGLKRGCPDLVIWDEGTKAVRFVEVKWRLRDRPTDEQGLFFETARRKGFVSKVVEWEFCAT